MRSQKASRVGLLLVHGIGNHKSGSLVETMFESSVMPYIQTLDDVQDVRLSKGSPGAMSSWTCEIQRGDGSLVEVLISEFLWHKPGIRPSGFRMLSWIIRILPAIILLLISLDRRDAALLDDSNSADEEMASFVRLGVRGLLIATTCATVVLTSIGHPLILVPAGGLICITIFLRGINIVGDVQVAVAETDKVNAILGDLEECYINLRRNVGRTVVVAHSQGGYLAHQWLRRRRLSKPMKELTNFIGVGSGLKPIYLLGALRDNRTLVACWMFLGAAVAVFSIFWELLLATVSNFQMMLSFAEFTGGIVLYRPDTDEFRNASRSLDTFAGQQLHSWRTALANNSQQLLWALLMMVVALAISRVAWNWRLAHWLDNGGRGLDLRGLPGRWIEFSTHQDMVGRLIVPQLHDAREASVAGIGHPLFDHLTYFHPTSRVVWAVNRALVRSFPNSAWEVPEETYLALAERREHRRQTAANILRVTAVLVFLVVASPGMGASISLASGPRAALRVGFAGVWLLGFFALLGLISCISSALDRRRLWAELRSGSKNGRERNLLHASQGPTPRIRKAIGFVVLVGPSAIIPGLVMRAQDSSTVIFAHPRGLIGCAVVLVCVSFGGAMLMAGFDLHLGWAVLFLAVFIASWIFPVTLENFASKSVWHSPGNSPELMVPALFGFFWFIVVGGWILSRSICNRPGAIKVPQV